jgi:ubiquinone/menaquinone biosynthesis C-methylase UbiE
MALVRTMSCMPDDREEQAEYRDRAALYDRIYAAKDYPGEAARVRAILHAAGIPDGARVVEAACGTGNYLVPLSKTYAVEGFDLNEPTLAIARGKLPSVRLWRGDMTDFTLDRPADALLCLFSSFGYVEPSQIPSAAACFFRAVRPGGVALVEPWITPEDAKPGHMSVQKWDGAAAAPPTALQVVRAGVHLAEGRASRFAFHWLVLTPQGVEHFVDRHTLWQSTSEELLAAFRGAGFEASWLSPGPLMGRGLLLCRHP